MNYEKPSNGTRAAASRILIKISQNQPITLEDAVPDISRSKKDTSGRIRLGNAVNLLKFEGLIRMRTDALGYVLTRKGEEHVRIMGFEIYPSLKSTA